MEIKDCFISYSHKNEKQVEQIVNSLRNMGYSILMDKSFSIGDDWKKKAKEYILSTKCTLLFFSDEAFISEPILEELKLAEKESKRSNYRYFVILLDNEFPKDKYNKLKSLESIEEIMICSDMLDYLPEEMIYTLNDRDLLANLDSTLQKNNIIPSKTNIINYQAIDELTANYYAYFNFEKEITIFTIPNNKTIISIKDHKMIDCNGNHYYRLVFLPTPSKKEIINHVLARRIQFFDELDNELFSSYINNIDTDYSENILQRGYNCLNLDFKVDECFKDIFLKTKCIKLNLDIYSIQHVVTECLFKIYINGIKDVSNNPDKQILPDLETVTIHHTKTEVINIHRI